MPTNLPPTSSNVAAIAGGTIGGLAALVLIGTALIFLRRRRAAQAYKSIGHDEHFAPQKEPIPLEDMYTQPSELSGSDHPAELSGIGRRTERSELG